MAVVIGPVTADNTTGNLGLPCVQHLLPKGRQVEIRLMDWTTQKKNDRDGFQRGSRGLKAIDNRDSNVSS